MNITRNWDLESMKMCKQIKITEYLENFKIVMNLEMSSWILVTLRINNTRTLTTEMSYEVSEYAKVTP